MKDLQSNLINDSTLHIKLGNAAEVNKNKERFQIKIGNETVANSKCEKLWRF